MDYDSGFNAKIRYYLESDNGVKSDERRSIKKSRLVKSNKQIAGPFFILNPLTGVLRVNFSHGNLSEGLGLHNLVIRVSR